MLQNWGGGREREVFFLISHQLRTTLAFPPSSFPEFYSEDHEIFSSYFLFYSISWIFCPTKEMKFFLRASGELLKYSYHIHIICHMYFFLCKLEQALEVSFVKYTILSTHWQSYFSEKSLKKLFYRCANIGASNDSLLASTRLYFKEIEETLIPCNILTLQAMLLQIYFCTLFHIFLTIQSHTLILL